MGEKRDPSGTAAEGRPGRVDYSSNGFVTFDCLGWPVTAIPEGGGTSPAWSTSAGSG